MRKTPFIVVFGFFVGIFYTNCTPNQFSLKEQASLTYPPSPAITTTTTAATNSTITSPDWSSWKNWYGNSTSDLQTTDGVLNRIKYAYSRHWKTGKVFAVFNTLNETLKLKQGEAISSIKCTDGYFIETTDCSDNFTITDTANGKQLKLKSTVSVPIDTNNDQIKGVGYIITTIPAGS